MVPLRDELLSQQYTVTFMVEAGSITVAQRVPESSHVLSSLSDVLQLFNERSMPDGVITSSNITRKLQRDLQEHLPPTTLFFLISDARKVLYKDITRAFPRGRGILLANDLDIDTIGPQSVYYPGLPRFDALVRMPEVQRRARRRALRVAETGVKEDDFVVLFVAQRSETARAFQDVATALRAIHTTNPDRPIRRVLAVLPHTLMDQSERVLWNDVLSMQSVAGPGVRVLPDITTIQRDAMRDEKNRATNQHLVDATITDAVIAADLVISSTSSVLLTAAALGKMTISYFAPGYGATAYEREIAGNPNSWEFHPEGSMCIAKSYDELREAIQSAIPTRRLDDTLEYTNWPANPNADAMTWIQGSNTAVCVNAIFDAFRTLTP